jgi:hypothetical protein
MAPAPNAAQQNLELQQLIASQEATTQALDEATDELRLLIIQDTSDPNLAKALLDQMGQPDPIQQALSNQLHGLGAISQSKADQLSQPATYQRAQAGQLSGGTQQTSSNLNSLTAQGVAACSTACMNDASVNQYAAQCDRGSASSCYRAAAALCQCNLTHGGCGNDAQQLQACVVQNTNDASALIH